MGMCHRQGDGEDGATAIPIADGDRTAVHLYIGRHEVQSHATASGVVVVLTLEEPFKDMLLVGITDTSASITDGEYQLFRFLVRLEAYLDTAGRGRELISVGEEIRDDFLHLVTVIVHRDLFRGTVEGEGDGLVGEFGEVAADVTDGFHDIALMGMEHLFIIHESTDIEHLVDEVQQSHAITVHEAQLLHHGGIRLLLQQGGEGREDQRQRGPQLMAEVREEFELRLLEFLFFLEVEALELFLAPAAQISI